MPNANTIRDHRSLFRQLLTGMYDAVLITDPNGHLLELNPRAKEFFQYETDEVIDRPIGLFIPGVTPAIVQRIRAGLDQARHMMLDANCLRKDRTSFSAEVTVSVIDLMDPGDLVFTIRNTERRRRQLERFRTKENAADVAQSALFACHPDGRFRWVNQSFLDMFGYENDGDVLKLQFAEILADEPLQPLFAKACAGETGELRLHAEGDGEDDGGDVEVRLAPDLHGKKIVGAVGSVTRV